MKKIVIIIGSWLLVILWMGLIFYFSDMTGGESTSKSVKTIETTIKKAVKTTNDIGLTKKDPNSNKVSEFAKDMNAPLRKMVHAFEYFTLVLLLINALYQSGVKGNKMLLIALLISFLYACSDEFHQSFTERTSSITDVLIDTSGAIIGIILIKVIKKLTKKNISAN